MTKKIKQTGFNGEDMSIDVVRRKKANGFNLIQEAIRTGDFNVDDIFIKDESIPALISALDPERDKMIQELEKQVKAAYDLSERMAVMLESKYWSENFRDNYNEVMHAAERIINTKQP